MKKWEFFVVATEEIINYYVVDTQANDSVSNIASITMRLRRDGQCPFLDLNELKKQQNVKQVQLICAVCAVEEYKNLALKIKKDMAFYIKQQEIDYRDQYKRPEHNTVSNTETIKVEVFENLTCFETIHLQSNGYLWYK